VANSKALTHVRGERREERGERGEEIYLPWSSLASALDVSQRKSNGSSWIYGSLVGEGGGNCTGSVLVIVSFEGDPERKLTS